MGKINEWLNKWHKRFPPYNDFYWGKKSWLVFPKHLHEITKQPKTIVV